MNKVGKLFDVDTFEDVIKNTKEVHKTLKNIGCFKSVNITVDALPDPAGEDLKVSYGIFCS